MKGMALRLAVRAADRARPSRLPWGMAQGKEGAVAVAYEAEKRLASTGARRRAWL
jgi:hypothetical protein